MESKLFNQNVATAHRKRKPVVSSFARAAKVSLAALLLSQAQGSQALSTESGVVRVGLEKELVQRPPAAFPDEEDLLLGDSGP